MTHMLQWGVANNFFFLQMKNEFSNFFILKNKSLIAVLGPQTTLNREKQ